MTDDIAPSFRRIRDQLAGQHLLVTGATGFLAKAFLEKLLRSVDTLGGIHLLVRPRPGGASPKQRLFREVLGTRVFDRLRATIGDAFGKLCEEKVHVVGGDLSRERFGLDPSAYQELTRRVTLVVNSAATVTFDERLDLALELNTLGPQRLLRLAQDCGNIPFLHVSTSYVCGARMGAIVEDFSAPEPARERLPRLAGSGEFNLDGLVETLRAEAAQRRHQYGADTEVCRQQLIDVGMEQAQRYGWNDTYTFTKWIAEQLLIRDHGDVPLVIFRPAIIESSFEEPTPGWIDGLRMADPIIVSYGRGHLKEFPALAHINLDLIPVDFVANAMIAALPRGEKGAGGVALYHCASSERHPLALTTLLKSLQRAFLKRPMNAEDGRPIHHSAPLKLVNRDEFLRRWQTRQRRVVRLRRLLEGFHVLRKRARRLGGVARQIDQLIYFAKIYAPYTHLDCRFTDDALQALAATLHPDDRAEFPFDVRAIDWDDYIVNRHVPGLRSFVLGTGAEPSGRMRAVQARGSSDAATSETLRDGTLFDVFQRSARLFPDKPALQVRRNGRWLRYTYDEAFRATGTIVRRFLERGLRSGDRVAICGENGPEWGLTYLAVMRAGMTAVPLDPQLPPREAWDSLRYARAKLMCAGATTLEGLKQARRQDDADLVAMVAPFIPPPAASRDPAPEIPLTAATSIASILFTSGTTVAPKAVPLTHRNFMANAGALLQVHPIHSDDEFLSVLPMYHAFEFTGAFIVPLASGATITYLDHLKGAEIRAAMQATGTTVMLVVPRLVRMLHDAVSAQVASAGIVKRMFFRILSLFSNLTRGRYGKRLFRAVHRGFGGRLRMLVSGGSRLDPELFDAFQRLGFDVYEGYGLTETGPVLAVNPPGAARAGSVGPMLPNVEIEVRHQNLEGVGEVWVRGANVMAGYLDNPEATAEILVGGWLRTGDLGRMDAEGYLHLTGRSKDLIVTGAGKNVYPDEVEMRYRDLPYVKEFCVFGMPADDGLGDVIHAVVTLDFDANPALDRSSLEREVRLAAETIAESLPSHQRIAVLHFWERELPKTSTLKAKRNQIRAMVELEQGQSPAERGTELSGAHAEHEPPDGRPVVDNPAALDAVREILAAQCKRAPNTIRRSLHLLLDLGIDSIGKIDVLGAIEARFDMRIDDEKAAKIARVADLLNVIGERRPKGTGIKTPSTWHRRLAEEAPTREGNGHLSAPLVPVRWLVRGGLSVFMNTYVRVQARGRRNVPDCGSFILAPNHSSHLDSPAVLTAVGGKRRVWVAGAEDYFFNTIFRRFLFGKMLDTIAFDRQADGVRGLRRCGDALSRGDGLLLFPEGTRSTTGELQPFKIGVAVLAVERGVPIVPVYIDHTYELFRKGQRFIRPGTALVSFGQPIHPPPLPQEGDPFDIFRELTRQVESAVIALRDEVVA